MEHKHGIAIDIDDTLADTRQYYFEKLYKQFGTVDGLSLRDLIEKYTFTENVPAWKTPEVLLWIQEDSTSNQTQQDMPVMAGALDAVTKINTILPVRMYITSRPSVVVEGTKRWLAHHGFPDAEIVTRPYSEVKIHGNSWKADILKVQYPSVSGIIDDNPEIIEALGPEYQGRVYIFSKSSQHLDENQKISYCLTWDDVLSAITHNSR